MYRGEPLPQFYHHDWPHKIKTYAPMMEWKPKLMGGLSYAHLIGAARSAGILATLTYLEDARGRDYFELIDVPAMRKVLHLVSMPTQNCTILFLESTRVSVPIVLVHVFNLQSVFF